ncbi:chromosomal replication initiator protein DnaA [Clostridiaceae bacterium AF42-6]|nr:chromosomal replication initiator protein DnaA [Clostridiales bacterium AM23-16LB]RHO83392.1 chromosomal replication initiator protein DnaA [Clostridiaceae bacterium AF42-6]RHP47495.1 chromosomal replication initiator protein DnaA [Clostridiaceae bacterium AF31-3BH]RHQ22865.1 chromosomal replication initiator protein DnaA [Clostridiaceae bacterium AF29-16BH]RHT81110.1 chromosomal replication initiator protein DnaA [Clostridiaceae bacterium AM27-36LB]RHW01447.1 chromosomal replication initia
MELLKEKWDKILESIRDDNELSNVAFKTWLLPLKVFRIEGNILKITAPFEQAATYVENKYKTFLYVAVAEAMGEEYEIRIITEDEALKEKPLEPETPKKAAAAPAPKVAEEQKTNLNPRYTFDTFVIGSNNRFAHAAALAVAESPGKEYNPLFLYGGVGLGKTHLMHSVAHYILQQDPTKKVLYVTSEVFTNELIDSIRNGNNNSMTAFREKYRNIDVLLIDDVQFIIGKESTQEEFFHTFNALHSANKQIIISSDRPPKDMETLEARLQSRFEWGLIADISSPDYETRMAILRKKEELDGYNIDDEVIRYIATNIKSNIRELEGALNKLVALSNLEKREINISMAEEVLKDIISPNQKREVTPQVILEVVAEHYGISVSDIIGGKRNAEIVTPRQVVMYLCREITDTPYKAIGILLGNRDHSTIINGDGKVRKQLQANDGSLKNNIDIIRKKLSS